jgi:hypothetical protein
LKLFVFFDLKFIGFFIKKQKKMKKEKEKIMSNMDREYLSNVLGAIYSYSENNCIIPIEP